STKVNNDFTIVDKVKAEAGGTESGDDYVRVSTNVPGSVHGRALGTILDPRGKAIVNINKGEAFYGEVDLLGKPYVTGYDPIKDALRRGAVNSLVTIFAPFDRNLSVIDSPYVVTLDLSSVAAPRVPLSRV